MSNIIEFEAYQEGYVAEMPRNWFGIKKMVLTHQIDSKGRNEFTSENGQIFKPYPEQLIWAKDWRCTFIGKGIIIMKPNVR